MKVIRDGRTLHISEMPDTVGGFGCLTSLSIEIRYTGDASVWKAIPLDNYIIPIIVKALEETNNGE